MACTRSLTCTQCQAPASGNPIVSTSTAADGTFTLSHVPSGTNIPIVLQCVGSNVAAAMIDGVAKNNARNPEHRVIYLNCAALANELTNEKCDFWQFRFAGSVDMRAAARIKSLPKDIAAWCYKIPAEEKGKYPIDQTDGGEDDDPAEHRDWADKLKAMGRNPRAPWKSQDEIRDCEDRRRRGCPVEVRRISVRVVAVDERFIPNRMVQQRNGGENAKRCDRILARRIDIHYQKNVGVVERPGKLFHLVGSSVTTGALARWTHTRWFTRLKPGNW